MRDNADEPLSPNSLSGSCQTLSVAGLELRRQAAHVPWWSGCWDPDGAVDGCGL